MQIQRIPVCIRYSAQKAPGVELHNRPVLGRKLCRKRGRSRVRYLVYCRVCKPETVLINCFSLVLNKVMLGAVAVRINEFYTRVARHRHRLEPLNKAQPPAAAVISRVRSRTAGVIYMRQCKPVYSRVIRSVRVNEHEVAVIVVHIARSVPAAFLLCIAPIVLKTRCVAVGHKQRRAVYRVGGKPAAVAPYIRGGKLHSSVRRCFVRAFYEQTVIRNTSVIPSLRRLGYIRREKQVGLIVYEIVRNRGVVFIRRCIPIRNLRPIGGHPMDIYRGVPLRAGSPCRGSCLYGALIRTERYGGADYCVPRL